MFDQYKTLNNGVKIPMLGLGVFRMENADTEQSVCDALEIGYRHIDTAAIYGNEEAVGRGIKKSGIKREDIFITTKLWNEDMRSGKINEAFDKSMSLMGLDYLDLYLIHWPVVGKFIESYLGIEKLYKEGKIRAIGVSNFNIHHIDELMEKASVVPVINQVELHPLLSQVALMEYCDKKGIALEAYAPFGGAGAPVLELSDIRKIADEMGKTPAQVILRWDIQRGVVVIPKSIKKERILANSELDFVISEQDMQKLDSLNADTRYNADPETFNF